MKKPLNIKQVFEEISKAKRYVQLQNNGVSQMEATYMVFGNIVGDEMVRMRQHELIFEQPILN